jgi:uncharacterized protein YgbK (DUF1537 family)
MGLHTRESARLKAEQEHKPFTPLCEARDARLIRKDKELAHLSYRLRVLPEQLDRARARVRQLESEARRYGMFDLIAGNDQ